MAHKPLIAGIFITASAYRLGTSLVSEARDAQNNELLVIRPLKLLTSWPKLMSNLQQNGVNVVARKDAKGRVVLVCSGATAAELSSRILGIVSTRRTVERFYADLGWLENDALAQEPRFRPVASITRKRLIFTGAIVIAAILVASLVIIGHHDGVRANEGDKAKTRVRSSGDFLSESAASDSKSRDFLKQGQAKWQMQILMPTRLSMRLMLQALKPWYLNRLLSGDLLRLDFN